MGVSTRAGVHFMMPIRHRLWLIVLLAVVTGCAGPHRPAPVYDRYNPAENVPSHYVVSRGDTLFSIAWRYGFDVKRLANANRIAPPYTIFPGQTLQLKESAVAAVSTPKTPSSKTARNASASSAKTAAATTPPTARPQPRPSAFENESWRWPVHGPLVRRFVASGQAHKGIDIKGKMGEPVKASRSGVVVYAGSGLVGYGNLLILKHSDRYLSAYGHNRRLLVKEGEQIKAGQTIAELGDSGTDSAKLHFEVRVNGKPVDPLKLLPRR